MTDLYLILHKVRGEPAFDIAQKVQIGDEEGWIIPTSGHRAYPAEAWELGTLRSHVFGEAREIAISDLWRELPDHYSTKRDDTPLMDKLRSALKFKPKPPLRRL